MLLFHQRQRLQFPLLGLLGIVFLLCLPGPIQADPYQEGQVKAAFMFNMMKFIHWPETTFAGPEEPWIVNVLGESPFAEAIGDMAGRTVQSRRIVVRYLPGQQPVEPGQVLVLTDETSPNDTLPEDIGSGSVLIVGDRRNFLNEGGIVNFLLIDNRVRFEINLDEARKRNLDISSRLLQLAERVLNEAGDR